MCNISPLWTIGNDLLLQEFILYYDYVFYRFRTFAMVYYFTSTGKDAIILYFVYFLTLEYDVNSGQFNIPIRIILQNLFL